MRKLRHILIITAASVLLAGGALFSAGSDAQQPPFGGDEDATFATALWQGLLDRRFVGPDKISAYMWQGTQPHGSAIEFFEDTLTVDGETGHLFVKLNYRAADGGDTTVEEAMNDPQSLLASVTVMFQREAGYDPDTDNWFWARYDSAGAVFTNEVGMRVAGRVAKGMDTGCIACHTAAPGGDFVFTHDRLANTD